MDAKTVVMLGLGTTVLLLLGFCAPPLRADACAFWPAAPLRIDTGNNAGADPLAGCRGRPPAPETAENQAAIISGGILGQER